MSRTAISSVTLASLLVAATPGFGKAQATGSAQQPHVAYKLMSGATSGMASCGEVDPTADYIIKVFMNAGWQNGGKRSVVFNRASKPDADKDHYSDGTPDENGTKDILSGESNPFHIHLAALRNEVGGAPVWVKVRIAQRDGAVKFGTISLPDGTTVTAVGNGDNSQNPHPFSACIGKNPIAPVDPNNKSLQTAIFFLKIPAGAVDPSKPLDGESYNIIVIPTKASETPIVIDPKIINNG